MRVSCPFVLLAVFIAAQSECAPISPSNVVNHLDGPLEHVLHSVPITKESLKGDITHKHVDAAALSTAPSHLPALGHLPSINTSIDAHNTKRSIGNLGGLPLLGSGSLGNGGFPNPLSSALPLPGLSTLPTGALSGLTSTAGGLNPLASGLPLMNSLPALNSLPTSSIAGLTKRSLPFGSDMFGLGSGNAGGLNPLGGGLPMNPLSGGLPMNPLSGGLPMNALGGGLPMNPLSGGLPMNPLSGGLPMNPLSGGFPMMNSMSGLTSLPTSSIAGITKRGLGNLLDISALPALNHLPLGSSGLSGVNSPVDSVGGLTGSADGSTSPLKGVNSLHGFSSLSPIPFNGITGAVPMTSSIPGLSSLPGLNSKRGLTQIGGILGGGDSSVSTHSLTNVNSIKVPALGSLGDAFSGFSTAGGAL